MALGARRCSLTERCADRRSCAPHSTRVRRNSASMAKRSRRWSRTCARKIDQVAPGGGEAAREPVARGKLLPRERVRTLLDPGSPFLELSQLAAHGMYDDAAPGAGIITGIGRVARPGMHDRRQRRHREGRHLFPDDGEEAPARAGDRAQNRLPCIYLVDSGGANLPHQDEVFPDREHFGRIFYNQANMSALRHSADRRGDGLVHRGRRLRAGDVRRERSSSKARARSSWAARRW